LFRNLSVDPNDPNCDDPNCSPDPNVYDMEDYTTNACFDPNYSGDCLDPNADTTFGLPEGTQFCDYDRDGDLDLFCGNRLWQNVSVNTGQPRFRGLRRQACGLVPTSGDREEGGAFIDVDMDGDLDVVRVSFGGEAYANEHFGDGGVDGNTLLPFMSNALWGLSPADWDNDGDVDLTVGRWFLRNNFFDSTAAGIPCTFGEDCFEFVTFADDPNLANAIPAWADVDRDGDLDCAQPAFVANPTVRQRLFRNHLYTDDCNEPVKRYVNVRPVRAAPTNGLNNRDYTENEFGAIVELVVRNDPNENTRHLRRVQFTASSSGYLNQNEYPLHFAPPADPDPNDPNEDVRFDLYVDFPSLAGENWRVDWTVNRQLANINLAQLYVDPNDEATWGRPITVFRDGRVRFKGADPNDRVDDPSGARMYLLGGPLRLPPNDPNDPNSALPGLTSGSKIVGCRFTKGTPPDPNTDPAASEVRIREFIIDGQLDEPDPNGCPYNLVVIDVTDPNNPVTIGGLNAKTFPNNRRTFIPVPPDPNDPNNPDWFVLPLDPNNTHTYDVRARVTSYRANNLSDLSALSSPLGVTVSGGLQIVDSANKDICTEKMNLTFGGGNTSPVKVRLSRKSN